MNASPNASSFAFAFGDAYFAVCKAVEKFLGESVRPILSRGDDAQDPTHLTYVGAVIRVHAWLRSLGKLNHPGDFQAVLAGSRALFEIAVDLTLLAFDSASPCDKLLAWEDSAKLHSAERLERYCRAHPAADPDGAHAMLEFLAQRNRIVALRRLHWGHEKHPPRWTGPDLGQDADAADGFSFSGFAEYYNARYPQVCWNVHGSGLAGVRALSEDHFPGLTAFPLREASHFALLAARRALEATGRWDPVSDVRFKEFEKELDRIRVHVWLSHGAPK